MAKTNFERVEERLKEGLLKIKKAELLEQADRHRSSLLVPSRNKEEAEQEQSKKKLMNVLSQDMKKFIKSEGKGPEDEGPDLTSLIENPADLSPEDWVRLKQMKKEMDTEEEEDFFQSPDQDLNQQIVENERFKHINKRFNIRDGWLPLK